MSQDTLLKDEDGNTWSLDNVTTRSYLDGQVQGIEIAVVWLKEKAVELFRTENDEKATAMRKLAIELQAALVKSLESRALNHSHYNPNIIKPYSEEA